MKMKKILVRISLPLFAVCAFADASFAFDLSLLKNDKESESHAYNNAQRHFAKQRIKSDTADRAFTLLGETFNDLEKNGGLCDLTLYHTFISKLRQAELPSDRKAFQNILIVWRSDNLIDDLFYEIMTQIDTLDAAMNSSSYSYKILDPNEIRSAEQLLEEKKISNGNLSSIYQGLKGKTMDNPGCSVNIWRSITNQLAGPLKGSTSGKLRLMNIAARSNELISAGEFHLAEFYRERQVEGWDLTLGSYLNILNDSKNKSLPQKTTPADLKPNTLSSQRLNKFTNLTYRRSLFARFSSMQINMISDVLKKCFERMDATKTEVVFTFATGSETLPVSPMGQYYLARKLLRKDITDLRMSSFFGGTGISHEDLLAASLETGLINADMVEATLKLDDLWNPSIPAWKKIANYGFRVTGTATLFLPPPYNMISSIALVFLNGLIAQKTAKPGPGENPDDIF